MIKRLLNLIKGFFLGTLSKAEASNPKAILEAEKQNMRDKIKKFDNALVEHRGKVIQAKNKQEKLTKERADLKVKVKQLVANKHNDIAGKFAKKLKDIDLDLEELVVMVTMLNQEYENLKQDGEIAIAASKERIEQMSNDLEETEMLESMAEIKEMSAGISDSLADDGLSNLQAMIEEQKAEAQARSEISSNRATENNIEFDPRYRQATEDSALAEFLAEEGMEPIAPEPLVAPSEPIAPSRSDMGPIETAGSAEATTNSAYESSSSSSSYESSSSYDSGGSSSFD